MIHREGRDTAGSMSGAIFSDCERYRYRLWREWNPDKATLAFLLLNPSTADESVNDPTIERCMRRAINWGYGRLEIVNLFPWRDTDPENMMAAEDPIGPKGKADGAILDAIEASRITVCGWGEHGDHLDRANAVTDLVRMAGMRNKLHMLKLNKSGHPAHPLYLPYSLRPKLIEWT